MVGVRRLPFIPVLQPDEVFVSFLDRTVAALEVTRAIVLQVTGVVARTDIHPIAFGVDLTAEAFCTVELATDIGREPIEASMLRRCA